MTDTFAVPFSTVLFDVDGTLIDSNGAHADTWTQALRDHGVDVDVTRVRTLIGMGADKLLPEIAHVEEDSPIGEAIAQRKKALFSALLPSLQPTRGARALAAFLKDRQVEMVIATSAGNQEMDALLARAMVADLIPMRASKDDAQESKPDPDIVRAAMRRAHARPDATVLVGDTPYDMEAARRAGIPGIALRCGGFWADEALREAAAIFDDPAALLAHLQAGWKGRVA